jgi:DNA-binding HxlR family transcriptional regulator
MSVTLESEQATRLEIAARYFILIGDKRRTFMLLQLADGPKALWDLQGDRPLQETQRNVQKLKLAGLIQRSPTASFVLGIAYVLTRAGRRAATAIAELVQAVGD